MNQVVPLADLEIETVAWAKEMLALSPLSLRMLKASHNAADDGLAGVQQLAGDATLLFYMTEEAQEGPRRLQGGGNPTSGSSPSALSPMVPADPRLQTSSMPRPSSRSPCDRFRGLTTRTGIVLQGPAGGSSPLRGVRP